MLWKKDSSLQVGFFLATREIRRNNPWATLLMISVMVLTLLNMLLFNGIFGGIIGEILGSYKTYHSSDIFITPVTSKNTIEQTNDILSTVNNLPTLKAASVRYTAPAVMEYGYQTKVKPSDVSETAAGTLVGIDPIAEDNVTNLSKKIVAGSFLSPEDADAIVVGSVLMEKYTSVFGQSENIGAGKLKTADIGSRVRLTVNGKQKEVIIKGVITTENTLTDFRIFMTEALARQLMGNTNLDANEIAIALKPQSSHEEAKSYIKSNLDNKNVQVQTAEETIPSSVDQQVGLFDAIGNMIGGIALVGGAITIFVVIYVNAITRRKFIGILKGIGISGRAIEISYVFQALFYAISGVIITSIILLGFLVPYFNLHPIELPIISIKLSISNSDVYIRAIFLIVTAVISGFIPAWLVAKQNTLNAILGR